MEHNHTPKARLETIEFPLKKKNLAAANWTQTFNGAKILFEQKKKSHVRIDTVCVFFGDYSYAVYYKLKTSKQKVYQRSFWSTLVVNDAHNHLCQGIR